MKQHARRHCFWISCLVFIGCTQLRDPNQVFDGTDSAAAGFSSAGKAGENAAQGGGASGTTSGRAGSGSDGNVTAGATSGGGKASAEAGNSSTSNSAGEAGASAPDDCQDPSGFHGLGCYSCAPTEIFTLENACSSAACTRFDDAARLTLLGEDGKLPPLPTPEGGGGASGSSGAAGATGAAGAAGTGKACNDLAALGKVVYITGSSAAKPFLQQIAQQLVAQNIFIVYESTGSCIGVDAVVNGTAMTSGPNAAALSATYWDSSASNGVACDLPTDGVAADIGASDVFAQSCAGFELSNLDTEQVRDAHGPIQTMTFAVPANSAYAEISAEAAYFAFGFGAGGGLRDASGAVTIWNDEDYLFKRSPSSGTQAMLAAAIGVPAAVWKGKAHKTSDDVAADIQAAGQTQATANLALGIIAADYIDSKNLRAQVRVLAFQDSAQHCAVFPDSTSNAKDKRNVRDGHYPVWGPLHLLLRVDSLGNPINPANRQAVTDIVGYLSGTKALPNGVKLINVYAQSGLVPECAMHVTRSKDGGNIVPFQPSSPCSCLFDVAATGATRCPPCAVQADCAATETCSQGYCETQ